MGGSSLARVRRIFHSIAHSYETLTAAYRTRGCSPLALRAPQAATSAGTRRIDNAGRRGRRLAGPAARNDPLSLGSAGLAFQGALDQDAGEVLAVVHVGVEVVAG